MRLAWQQIPSTVVSDILCQSSLDGVVLDTEHACYNKEALYACIQIITANGKMCFVRLGKDDAVHMSKYCLDAGCTGIIFSTVETQEQAELINNVCRYPSNSGSRGLGLVRQNRWGQKDLVSAPPILIAQIETVKGVNNIKDLKNFDYYMIGPYDLSASLGDPGNFDNSLYIEAVSRIKDAISIEKMAVHIPTDVKKEIKKYHGYGIIAIGMDTTVLMEAYREMQDA